MHVTDHILAADHEATEAAQSAARLPPIEIPPSAVEAVLATLRDRAVAGKKVDPAAPGFVLAAWDPTDRHAAALHTAVDVQLRTLGFSPRVLRDQDRPGVSPKAIELDYDDLHAVAQLERERRAAWIEEALAAWRVKAGPTAAIDEIAGGVTTVRFSTTAICVPPEDIAPIVRDAVPRMRLWESDSRWSHRPAGEVVAEAVAALRPLAWTLEEIDRLWRERGGASVTSSRGLYREGDMLRVVTVIFSPPGDGEALTYDVDDLYALPAAEVVAKAAEDMKLPQPKGQRGRGQSERK